MKKVLVTGISGFVGQHCATELLKKGYAVRGSVRSLSKTDEGIRPTNHILDYAGECEPRFRSKVYHFTLTLSCHQYLTPADFYL